MTSSHEIGSRIANWTAPAMYWASVLFLIILSALIVLWVDIPRVSELHQLLHQEDTFPGEKLVSVHDPLTAERLMLWEQASHLLLAILVLWPLFWMEFWINVVLERRRGQPLRKHVADLFICLCPPFRLCARNRWKEGQVWLPFGGWHRADATLRRKLERAFSLPMIVIALMILPVLLVEFGMAHQVATHAWLRTLLHISTGLIWFAFASEFIVMVSVADKRIQYCKEHWLDLAIILLPLISFLRSLRVIRATRLAKLAKVQQLTKMSRIYRLRGLAIKGVRGLMILELAERLFGRNLERRAQKLRDLLAEKELEVSLIRQEIDALEREIQANAAQASTASDRTVESANAISTD